MKKTFVVGLLVFGLAGLSASTAAATCNGSGLKQVPLSDTFVNQDAITFEKDLPLPRVPTLQLLKARHRFFICDKSLGKRVALKANGGYLTGYVVYRSPLLVYTDQYAEESDGVGYSDSVLWVANLKTGEQTRLEGIGTLSSYLIKNFQFVSDNKLLWRDGESPFLHYFDGKEDLIVDQAHTVPSTAGPLPDADFSYAAQSKEFLRASLQGQLVSWQIEGFASTTFELNSRARLVQDCLDGLEKSEIQVINDGVVVVGARSRLRVCAEGKAAINIDVGPNCRESVLPVGEYLAYQCESTDRRSTIFTVRSIGTGAVAAGPLKACGGGSCGVSRWTLAPNGTVAWAEVSGGEQKYEGQSLTVYAAQLGKGSKELFSKKFEYRDIEDTSIAVEQGVDGRDTIKWSFQVLKSRSKGHTRSTVNGSAIYP